MISQSNFLQSPSSPTPPFTQIQEFRVWRRRRLKFQNRNTSISCQFEPLNTFQNLISGEMIAPALGFAAGAALYLSRLKPKRNPKDRKGNDPEDLDTGECTLLASPTPFNQFVFLRCPSIVLEGSELSEKLVKEDGHSVKVRVKDLEVNSGSFGENFSYQRICVSTDDGGVISLDWPEKLDLREERGRDTTVVIVSGTPEGSMEKNIRLFVCELLMCGCFPIVMNPRGCAGSPLTTARLFTAADSDDVCTAIQFINKTRPCNTLMAVGWGYGANMLTKYLAEVAERTPLTAAACINNPFDLEEATKSFPYHVAADQELTSGLIDILRSNKELFLGRAKGFNVEEALSTTSLRDFDRNISMVSYGFESIEEFYSKSSTRESVGNVKIPLLLIQSDDGIVPQFSLPRSSVAENPFTSMFLCSCLPSTALTCKKTVLHWCKHFVIEWLTSVELGLLKGCHPLLKDVDVVINPSAGLALVESRVSSKNSGANNFLNITEMDASNGYASDGYPVISTKDDTTNNVHLESQGKISESAESQGEIGEMMEQSGSDDTALINDTVENSADNERSEGENSEMLDRSGSDDTALDKSMRKSSTDNERSQVLQSAEVVMNMLDVSMPGTLQEEQKKKVLSSMEQGETLMKALERALSGDVSEELTTAVSEVATTQGTQLNLDGIMNISLGPLASSGVQRKMQETSEVRSSGALGFNNIHSQEQMRGGDEMAGEIDDTKMGIEKHHGLPKSDVSHAQILLQPSDEGRNHGDIPSSGGKEVNESYQNQDKEKLSIKGDEQSSGYDESGCKTDPDINSHSGYENAADLNVVVSKQGKENIDNGMIQMSTKETDGIQMSDDTNLGVSYDKNKPSSVSEVEESPATSSIEPPLVEVESNRSKKDKNKNIQPIEGQNNQGPSIADEPAPSVVPPSDPSSFNVPQGIDALTEFDDSTQVAVNSVFEVVENMIVKSEDDNAQENDGQGKTEDREPSSAFKESPISSDTEDMSGNKQNNNGLSLESDQRQCKHPLRNHRDKSADIHQNVHIDMDEKQLDQSHSTPLKKNDSRFNFDNEKDERMKDVTDYASSAKTSYEVEHLRKFPLYVTMNPYRDSVCDEHLHPYLLSPNAKSLDSSSTAALLLDYLPKEGQWKFLDQFENNRDPDSCHGTPPINGRGQVIHSSPHANDANKINEASYIISDTGKEQQPIECHKIEGVLSERHEEKLPRSELVYSVKNIILDSLKVEVDRRLGLPDMKEIDSSLALELEHVAEVVSLAVWHTKELKPPENISASVVGCPLLGEDIVEIISLAINDSVYLKKVLPVDVIIGSSLAALKEHFSVVTQHNNQNSGGICSDCANNVDKELKDQVSELGSHKLVSRKQLYSDSDSATQMIEKHEAANSDSVIAGAVTVLGASTLLGREQSEGPYNYDGSVDISSGDHSKSGNRPKKLEKADKKGHKHIVSSLAEKAMSVAGPVVPTKSDGGLDQERLVTMLSDLGQKGGILKTIGKVALLWGGARGAVRLTDRLIAFLHIGDRPLYQRLLGFACMVLVLWSPVVIPLFPTMVKAWATHNSTGIAEYVCVIGLYTAVAILVLLWGKRIRGYNDPIEQYGLDLTSKAKLFDFLKGLTGGIMLVLSIHSINALLGYAHLSWSSLPSSSPDAIKACGGLLVLVCQGIMMATVVVIVEEILFRSWLPEEISVDFGYHRAILISGFAFSVLQRSLHSIPGLWLLSIALFGLRQRSKGSLSIPIGIRAGILSSSFILQTGRFLIYHSSYPLWLVGTDPLQPFGGAVGLAFCIMLAVRFYPKQPHGTKRIQRTIRE